MTESGGHVGLDSSGRPPVARLWESQRGHAATLSPPRDGPADASGFPEGLAFVFRLGASVSW